MEVTACANGIVEIANAAMINALRIVTVQRGYDPRDLVMVAFGGAGPLHAALLCAEMQIPLLIVPPSPGTATALGLLVTDLRHEFSQTRIMPEGHEDVAAIQRIFDGMEADGRAALAREGLAATQMSFLRQVEMRYEGQSHEIAVDLPLGTVDAGALHMIRGRFHEEHDRTYGHGYPDQPTELVNFRLTAIGQIPKPRLREIPTAGGDVRQAAKGNRLVYFAALGDFVTTTVYDRSKLAAGHSFVGPAVVEEVDSTTLVPSEFKVDVDRWGDLLISPKPPAA
jgi:N-methylhydantoinase A